MKTIIAFMCLNTFACSTGSGEPQDAATETSEIPVVSMCQLDGGFAVYCNQWTTNEQAWSWFDMDGSFHLCNDEVKCPTGTACIAVNTTNQEQYDLTGSCP